MRYVKWVLIGRAGAGMGPAANYSADQCARIIQATSEGANRGGCGRRSSWIKGIRQGVYRTPKQGKVHESRT
jgi:hypothetical protein